jgi:hypothetical protein
MFPTMVYAPKCRFCEAYVSEYVFVVFETGCKVARALEMSSDGDLVYGDLCCSRLELQARPA